MLKLLGIFKIFALCVKITQYLFLWIFKIFWEEVLLASYLFDSMV